MRSTFSRFRSRWARPSLAKGAEALAAELKKLKPTL
jgi:hypothetical protein